jgi:hypothetical protein
MTDVEYLDIKFSSVHSYLIGKLTKKLWFGVENPLHAYRCVGVIDA